MRQFATIVLWSWIGLQVVAEVLLEIRLRWCRRESVMSVGTLRASLSGTFLQTLPDLVTPLKGH